MEIFCNTFSKSESWHQNVTFGWSIPIFLSSCIQYLGLGCCSKCSKRTRKNKNMVKTDLLEKWNYTSRWEGGQVPWSSLLMRLSIFISFIELFITMISVWFFLRNSVELFFMAVQRFELSVSCLLGRWSPLGPHSRPLLRIFETKIMRNISV
jgi:hypothetical protein